MELQALRDHDNRQRNVNLLREIEHAIQQLRFVQECVHYPLNLWLKFLHCSGCKCLSKKAAQTGVVRWVEKRHLLRECCIDGTNCGFMVCSRNNPFGREAPILQDEQSVIIARDDPCFSFHVPMNGRVMPQGMRTRDTDPSECPAAQDPSAANRPLQDQRTALETSRRLLPVGGSSRIMGHKSIAACSSQSRIPSGGEGNLHAKAVKHARHTRSEGRGNMPRPPLFVHTTFRK